MAEYQHLAEVLNRAATLAEAISDPEEQAAIRRPIGDLMGRLWTELMGPIVQRFPDLDPDKS
jgi:hypothetical protein